MPTTFERGSAIAGVCGLVPMLADLGPWWAQLGAAIAGAACLYLAKPEDLTSARDAWRRWRE